MAAYTPAQKLARRAAVDRYQQRYEAIGRAISVDITRHEIAT